MPLPEQYVRQQIETRAAAESESRWDEWRALVRVLAEIALWTVTGMVLVFFAFYTSDVALGAILWFAGCIVWIGGVAAAILFAYLRGEDQGLW